MHCAVPNCRNMLQEWIAPFPSDIVLMYRWKECIEIGSGLHLPDMETISKQYGVCSVHFPGFSQEEEEDEEKGDCYRQPSLFFRDDIVLEVENCCLCCRINVKDNMLEKNECIKENISLEEVVKNCLGTSCFHKARPAEYICEECFVKVDMIYAFQQQITSGKRELRKLQRKMKSENVCFQRKENKRSVEMEIEVIKNEASKEDEVEEELLIELQNATSKSTRSTRATRSTRVTRKVTSTRTTRPTRNRTLVKEKRHDYSSLREKLERSRLKCYICCIYLESSDSLLTHLMMTHTEQETLRCQECEISFERSPEYNFHLAKHDSEVRPYKCDHCTLRFAKVTGKTSHEAEHHNTESDQPSKMKKKRPKNYMCQTCGRTYRSQSDLNRHDTVQHKREIFVTCKTCNKPFASMRNLKRHLLIHLGEKPYVCKICGVSYRQSQNLLDHMNEKHREDSAELKYACNECDKRFASHRLLHLHRKTHDPNSGFITLASRNGGEANNKTICNICGTLFDKSILIIEHFCTEHPDLQLEYYPCSTCGEIFFRKQNLIVHSYNHSDRYACDQCGRRHNTEAKLEIHRYKVHGVQIADQYFGDCPHCDKKYPKGNLLLRHIKTHFEGRWSCEVCNKKFTERFHLTIHMRKHTGERPLVCAGCDARFGDPTVLSKHKKRCELFVSQKE